MNIITDISILKAKNSLVEKYEISDIINKLETSLKDSKTGVGLAAPQIGINKKAAIIRIKSTNENVDLVNPVLVDSLKLFVHKDEGCLSLPNKLVNVHRFKEIFIKDDLHPAGIILVGLVAVVVQHEIDHLNGILITDKIAGKIGRNDMCPCRKFENGKFVKYKNCHGR
jgi:peptide deformylase